MIKQISVFVENKLGRLAKVTKVLADADINLYAFSIGDTSDFGILRMIADKPQEAEAALKKAGLAINITQVLGLKLPDRPGSFAEAVKILSDEEISVEYMYAFSSALTKQASVVIRVTDNEKAADILRRNNIQVINEGEFAKP
ncbi:MAG: ACT domain-containing protein [Oscillospiraceae bacterium]|nr:ACT domain-containing protein [Oscillospiraceae bacterium]